MDLGEQKAQKRDFRFESKKGHRRKGEIGGQKEEKRMEILGQPKEKMPTNVARGEWNDGTNSRIYKMT
jgi:hypothetical protein